MEVGSVNSKNALDSVQNTRAKSNDDDFEKRLRAAAEKGDDAELKQVCKEFEGIFVNMLYKQMRATVPKSDYLQSDSATEIYNSMLDDKLSEAASQKGIGLGDMMYKQMSKQYLKQEDSTKTSGGVIDEKK
ncbi:MAG TPA: rod-binding protein [Ruminiclostridium sp.]